MACTYDRIFCQLIGALATVLDMEDDHKLHHAWRVAILSREVARRLWPHREGDIFYAGLLHDLGGIGLPDHIVHRVLRPGAEDDPEIRAHPERGAEMVSLLPGVGARLRDLVAQHHEHWDGSGYPRGLKDGEIDGGALLLNLSDVLDLQLRSSPGRAWEDVRRRMERLAGRAYPVELWREADRLLSAGLWERLAGEEALEGEIAAAMSQLPPAGWEEDAPLTATISLFARIIDAKHGYTGGHSQRVATYAGKLAGALGMEEGERQKVEIAGLLHDLGKVAVPRPVLDKPGRLDPWELEIVRKHPARTIELLGNVTHLKEIAPLAGLHHERYDGRGYPYGLKGSDIPLGARLIAVADAFDAMTSPRPYQPTRSPQEALEVLAREAGKQFDPQVVDMAEVLLDGQGIPNPN
ncbi:MAG TPA: phosphohydrolase [Peptococcaceae bacterium]|nr:MAG: Metal dependent phosphohydrolase [Moorella sp. 60_41]HBT46691.1 phosphohydrolase [Peptococcaceae bacterium]